MTVKTRYLLAAVSLACWLTPTAAAAQPRAAKRQVHLVATGGTISGGASGSLRGDDFEELVPGLGDAIELTTEDYVTIGSSRMTPEIQFGLAQRIQELFSERPALAGIVVTHGTDSLEETAFLLDLLIGDPRPVVFAAAQRPPRRIDTDGPRNLENAVRVAADARARGLGVLVTLNDEVHGARDVRKTHSVALDAFASPWVGPLGHVDQGRLYLFHEPARRLHLDVSNVEPRVTLVRLFAGSDGTQIRAAVEAGARGIVVEVFGRGNVPPPVRGAVEHAIERDVVVAYATRTGGGRIALGEGARTLGVLSAEDLDGLKARVVLVAALATTRDRDELQGYFRRLAGGPAE